MPSKPLRDAELSIDMGTHGTLDSESRAAGRRIGSDGEPAFTQFRMAQRLARGEPVPDYDAYFTVGLNIGQRAVTAPTCGLTWRHLLYPVVTRLFSVTEPPADAPFTTVMSWQAHPPFGHDGGVYGNKDVEFPKFVELPRQVVPPMEGTAVAGRDLPRRALESAGWRLRDSHEASFTFDRFCE